MDTKTSGRKFDEEWNIFIVSKYLLIKILQITKE